MAAVLRVKRPRTEDPADTLVISSKRHKDSQQNEGAACSANDSIDNVFKFAGTVDKKESMVGQQVRDAIRKAKLQREILRQHPQSANPRGRQSKTKSAAAAAEARSDARAEARYKVVSQHRAKDLDGLDAGDKEQNDESKEGTDQDKKICLVDLISEEDMVPKEPAAPETISCNGVSLIREQVTLDKDCVYDLYYINDPHFRIDALEHILAIEARRDNIYIDEREDSEDEQVYDEEDNPDDENNYRNDYPDEDYGKDSDDDDDDDEQGIDRDPFDSDDDEYYAQMLEDKLVIGEDCEEGGLSSDEDEENFVYYKDPSVNMSTYEQYKKRVTKELEAGPVKEEEEEEEDEDTETES